MKFQKEHLPPEVKAKLRSTRKKMEKEIRRRVKKGRLAWDSRGRGAYTRPKTSTPAAPLEQGAN